MIPALYACYLSNSIAECQYDPLNSSSCFGGILWGIFVTKKLVYGFLALPCGLQCPCVSRQVRVCGVRPQQRSQLSCRLVVFERHCLEIFLCWVKKNQLRILLRADGETSPPLINIQQNVFLPPSFPTLSQHRHGTEHRRSIRQSELFSKRVASQATTVLATNQSIGPHLIYRYCHYLGDHHSTSHSLMVGEIYSQLGWQVLAYCRGLTLSSVIGIFNGLTRE